MTLKRQLKTSKQNIIEIITDDPLAKEHFNNSTNYADVVLNQINQERLYDEIFNESDDLTILDIGGNIGLFSLYVQDRAKSVYPIEPTPNHFHILKELTKNYSNIHPLNYAVSDTSGIIDFYINEENTTMNSIANKYGSKVQVQTKTIYDIIKELNLDHVDLIKCDIEGSEMIALNDKTVGAVKDMVDFWFIEVHATNVENTTKNWNHAEWEKSLLANMGSISDLFTKHGYSIHRYSFDGLYIYKE